jgi:ribosomal protein S18 acetylase RimI-like enzyme
MKTSIAMLHVRRAELTDAAALTEFGARTFTEAFGECNDPADLAAHLESAYSLAQQQRDLVDPGYITLLIEADGTLAGYAQLRRHEAPDSARERSSTELHRFYVDRIWQGRGVAQQLMTAVREAARELGGSTIWLSVWEQNPRAIAFYAKCGFRDAGRTDFYVGSDRQTDLVMLGDLQGEVEGRSS